MKELILSRLTRLYGGSLEMDFGGHGEDIVYQPKG